MWLWFFLFFCVIVIVFEIVFCDSSLSPVHKFRFDISYFCNRKCMYSKLENVFQFISFSSYIRILNRFPVRFRKHDTNTVHITTKRAKWKEIFIRQNLPRYYGYAPWVLCFYVLIFSLNLNGVKRATGWMKCLQCHSISVCHFKLISKTD